MKSTSKMFKALFGDVILLLVFALVGHVEAAGTWSLTGSMSTVRFQGHTATLLPDNRVLVSGGANGITVEASAEIYDPALGTWSLTGSMSVDRYVHTATLLPDGRVLVSGGATNSGLDVLASAEIYDPALGTWSPTGSMSTPRYGHTATLLPDGRVLVSGGYDGSSGLASAEIFSEQPQNKDECKKNGWQGLTRADGTPFKNQGDCIQYVNTGK